MGTVGPYSGELIAKNTSLGLFNCASFSFQVVGWELDDIGDSAAFAAGLYDSLITKGATIDSLYAILDSIQNQPTWISSFDPSVHPVMMEAGRIPTDGGFLTMRSLLRRLTTQTKCRTRKAL